MNTLFALLSFWKKQFWAKCFVFACCFFLFLPSILFAKIIYKPEIIGCSQKIQTTLISVSRSFNLQKQLPLTIGLLQKRAERDIPAMQKALKSLGYYQSKITIDILSGNPAKLIFNVELGKRTQIGEIKLEYISIPPKIPQINLPFHSGEPALSETVLNAQKNILQQIGEQGYPFASITEQKVEVRHDTQVMNITYTLKTGEYAIFGTTTILGLNKVNPKYIQFLIPWKEGEEFNASLINQARTIFVKTGLFSSIDYSIKLQKSTIKEMNNTINIQFQFVERKHKTIQAGAGYSKDKGILGSLNWTHRNLNGKGEKLKISLEGNTKLFDTKASFQRPWLLRQDQTGTLAAQYKEEYSDAYNSRFLQTTGEIERHLYNKLWGGIGIGYRLSAIKEEDRQQDFGFFFIPFSGHWDNLNSLLRPTKGIFGRFFFAPYYDTLKTNTSFFKFSGILTTYIPLISDKLILCTRSRYSSIRGANLKAIPADIRFYAGGSRSVRGYAYQKAGEIKANGKPLGGRSLFEISGELQYLFGKRYGIDIFLDGGRAFVDTIFQINQPLLLGAGFGFSYFLDTGQQIRLDIATPINPRKDIDSLIQLYINLGMTF